MFASLELIYSEDIMQLCANVCDLIRLCVCANELVSKVHELTKRCAPN